MLIGADTGTTTGVQIKAETNYGQLMTRSSGSANATDAVIHHYNNNNSTFRVDNDGDIAKCANIDASGVITTTSNVSAVNITGSGVLSMTGTAEHNIHGELDMNTKKIINVVDPTTNQGVATKKYVDDSHYIGYELLGSGSWSNATSATASMCDSDASDIYSEFLIVLSGLMSHSYQDILRLNVKRGTSWSTGGSSFFSISAAKMGSGSSGQRSSARVVISGCSEHDNKGEYLVHSVTVNRELTTTNAINIKDKNGNHIKNFRIENDGGYNITGTFEVYGLRTQ